MKKSIKNLVSKIDGQGTKITGGFGSIRGGLAMWKVVNGSAGCTNSGTCTGDNTAACDNSGTCTSATNSGPVCTNSGSCFS